MQMYREQLLKTDGDLTVMKPQMSNLESNLWRKPTTHPFLCVGNATK